MRDSPTTALVSQPSSDDARGSAAKSSLFIGLEIVVGSRKECGGSQRKDYNGVVVRSKAGMRASRSRSPRLIATCARFVMSVLGPPALARWLAAMYCSRALTMFWWVYAHWRSISGDRGLGGSAIRAGVDNTVLSHRQAQSLTSIYGLE